MITADKIDGYYVQYVHKETQTEVDIVNPCIFVKLDGMNQWKQCVVYRRKDNEEAWFCTDVDSFRQKFEIKKKGEEA